MLLQDSAQTPLSEKSGRGAPAKGMGQEVFGETADCSR
jgi:hypothetical protein